MNVTISFRHMDPSEAIKRHTRGKVAKLQKFLRQPVTAKVTLSLDKLKHVVETKLSSGGAHLEAKESSDDMYAAIDRVMDKLERQIRGTKGAAQAKKRRSGDTLRGGKSPRPLETPVATPAKESKKAASKKVTKKPTKKTSKASKKTAGRASAKAAI